MPLFAADTTTPVEKTRAELEALLHKVGATAFGYMNDERHAIIQFKASERMVRFILPLPDPKDKAFTTYFRGSVPYSRTAEGARKEWEQACRSSWRALFLSVKAKLVAVDIGISTFEEEFLAKIVVPGGQTVGEMMIPQIALAYTTGKAPDFTLSLPSSDR